MVGTESKTPKIALEVLAHLYQETKNNVELTPSQIHLTLKQYRSGFSMSDTSDMVAALEQEKIRRILLVRLLSKPENA